MGSCSGGNKGGASASGGGAVAKENQPLPTKALIIDNMNEAQIDQELSTVSNRMNYLQKEMDKIAGKKTYKDELAKYWIGGFAGGAGITAAQQKSHNQYVERSTADAKRFTDMYNEKQELATRKSNLEKAKNTVRGTGKTVREIAAEKLKSTNITMDWGKATRSKSVYGTKTIRKSGEYKIETADGKSFLYFGSRQLGMFDRVGDAQKFAERHEKSRKK